MVQTSSIKSGDMAEIYPIDYPVVAKTYPLMYKMHKYWSRKPYNVIAEYIKHYTKEGDIILDPFCGSGVTAIEAIRLKRKVVAADLNPMAIFITKMTLEPINLAKFSWSFQDLKTEMEKKINSLYETKCPKCGQIGVIHHMEWNALIPVKIIYSCSCSQKPLVKDVEKGDIRLISDIDEQDIPFWYPKTAKLPPFRKEKYDYFYQLFTHRNLIALSVLFNSIDKIENSKVRDMMKFVFTSSLAQASKMKMITTGKPSATTKGWIAPRYYTPLKYQEMNVWTNFENHFHKIFKGKKECNIELQYYQKAENFEDIQKNNGTALLMVQSALDLSAIPKERIDYIFTDPPYGGNIQYLGLSALWGAWLGYEFQWKDEVTIDNYQKKGLKEYHDMMEMSFSNMHKLLKSGHHLTVSFHNTKKEPWESIIRTIVKSQLDLKQVIYQSISKSFGQSVRGKGVTPPGDYFICFQKPGYRKTLIDRFDEGKYESKVVSETKAIIAQRNEPTSLLTIMTQIYKKLDNSEILFGEERSINQILEDHLNKEFIQIKDKTSQDMRLWLRDTSNLSGIPLSKRVEDEIINILSWMPESSLLGGYRFDLLQGILKRFTGSLTPDPIFVLQKSAELEREYIRIKNIRFNRFLYYLAAYGKHEGFNIWLNKEKRGEMYRNKKLLDFCMGWHSEYSPILKEIENRTDNFDILWIKKSTMIQLEIKQNAKDISDAMIKNWKFIKREVQSKGLNFVRIFIIPQEKKKEFYEESFRNKCGDDWSIVFNEEFYEHIRQYPPDDLIKEDIQFLDLTKIREQKYKSHNKEGPLHTKATVIENEELQGNHFRMILRLEDRIEKIDPGQFLHILCDTEVKSSSQPKPLLRRPISIHSIKYEGFEPKELAEENPLPKYFRKLIHRPHPIVDILYKEVGEGTKFLSKNIKGGDVVDILGPLGKGIEVDDKFDTVILVAGGIGVAPLMALAERQRYEDKKVYALVGAFGKKDLPLKETSDSKVLFSFADMEVDYFVKEFKDIGVDVVVATEDKSLGFGGKVTELLQSVLQSDQLKLGNVIIYSCGPKPMLKEVAKIAKINNISCKVLLEERMACGVGACLSCVCKIKDEKGDLEYKLVCKEGPTFDAQKVIWDA